MKAVVVFVEGAADGWYVVRCLGQAGVQFDNRPPRDFETPFGGTRGFIQSWHTRIAADDLRLAEGSEGKEPVFQAVARDANTLYLIVRMGGDGSKSAGKIPHLQQLAYGLRQGFRPAADAVRDIALAFVYDADDPSHYSAGAVTDCVVERERRFAAELGAPATFAHFAAIGPRAQVQYALLGTNAPQHGQWVAGTDFPVGLFVMHDATTRQGALEAVLETGVLTASPWPDRLQAADQYLTEHQIPASPVATNPRDRAKARVTIAGQVEGPGMSSAQLIKGGPNAVIDSGAFGTAAPAELVRFLKAVPWS